MKLINTGKIVKTTIALFLFLLTTAVNADNGLVVKPSAYSVAETVDRLETIMKKKGITIFARINHAQGAKSVGVTMAPTELLIFGNPKLGSPLMLSQRTAAIDVPLKAIVWQDNEGKVWLAYNAADYIVSRHDITDQQGVVKKMNGALNKFSDFATKATQ